MATSHQLKFYMTKARAEAKSQGSSFRAPQEEAGLITYVMAEAGEEYGNHAKLVPKLELPADIQEIADFRFNDRLNVAIAKSIDLLNEASAQLEAPFTAFTPDELTSEELATKHRDDGWEFLNAKATEFNDVELSLNDELYEEVNELLDELNIGERTVPMDVEGLPRPLTPTNEEMGVPSDIANWISESREAGEKARAKSVQKKLLDKARAKAEQLSGMIAMRLR